MMQAQKIHRHDCAELVLDVMLEAHQNLHICQKNILCAVAMLEFQQAVLDAGAEVNNILTQYQTVAAKEEWRAKQIEALKNALVKTEKLMQYSSTPYLDVLTAKQSLLQAETAQAQGTYDKISAVINLYRALGGGQN